MKLSLIFGVFPTITFLCLSAKLNPTEMLLLSNQSASVFAPTNIIYLANNWYSYTAKDGSYTVYFPGIPEEKNLSVDSPLGILNALFVFYKYPQKERIFSASSVKYPVVPNKYNVEKGLDGARDGAANNSNSIIISEKKINYKNFPGREIILQSKVQSDFRLLLRMFIDPSGPTLYSLQVTAADGNLDFPEAKAFLDSFTISNSNYSLGLKSKGKVDFQ
ncbi:MAG: hypothetical protein QNJ68_13385 [Microcoleaceae cyanobacterium MO_207.B10]|nr:hypothetical protein [Microcoleaceae cyanobacterium MO_207.B10]